MTEESAKGKLTLSGKSTLTLKNLNKSTAADGKKVVQVEVRKKRILNQTKRNYTNSISNYNNCYAYFNRNFYKCYYR